MAFVLCLWTVVVPSFSVAQVLEVHAYVGDTVNLTGHAAPNSSVVVNVTRTLELPVSEGRFVATLEDIYVPDKSRFSLSASPVTSVKANGMVHGTTFSRLVDGDVVDGLGTLFFNDLPGGDYDITIYGDSSAGRVSVSIVAGQIVAADAAGNYSIFASSRGLPPGIYAVTADGTLIANVIVDAVPTPTSRPTVGSSGSIGIEQVAIGAFIVALAVMVLLILDRMVRKKK